MQAVGTLRGTQVASDALRLDVHLSAWANRSWERAIRCDGVVRGHGVASGRNGDPRFPGGTVAMTRS